MKFPEKVDKIAYCGDWHGNTHWATHILRELGNQGVKVVIHLGDYGYLFDEYYIQSQHDILEKYDMLLMFIDGNHESFSYLESIPIDKDGTRKITDRIWHLPRGFRWEWDGVKFLALGGAFSIDKHQRIPGFSWWEQETITFAEAQKAISGGSVDIMVTHDAPLSAQIPRMGFFNLPDDIQAAADSNRELLQEVGEITSPVMWWHGHMHCKYQDVIEFDNGQECQVTGLDCDGSSFNENVNIISMEVIKNLVEDKKVSTT